MKLRWFIKTSKSYMSYGKAYPKWKFWLRFPIAYAKFSIAILKDTLARR